MLKRLKLPGWIVIILLLTGVFFGFNKVIANVLDKQHETKETTVNKSIYPGVDIETHTKETDLYTLSVSQLYTQDKQINNSINEWIEQEKSIFTSNVKESKKSLEKNGFRAHLNIKANTEIIGKNIYAFDFESYQITSGANGMTNRNSLIVDLNLKKQLEINDIFQLDENSIKDIQKLILNELHNDKENSLYIFDDLVEEVIEDPNQWKWSFDEDNIIFYFDQYEIAAGAAGAIQAKIPLEKIKLNLTEDFSNKIDIKSANDESQQVKNSSKQKSKPKKTLNPDGKYVALTFDDGPHADVTPKILDTLEKNNAVATFYMLGSQVEYYPNLANEVKNAGHEIGDHTMNHQDLSVLDFNGVQNEMRKSHQIITDTIGQNPTTMRPPYGAWNDNVKKVAQQMNTPIIMWSVDSLDWKSRNATAVHDKVMSNVTPGAIVLLHDIHASTAEALPQLLHSLKDEGYETVTVSQLLDLKNEKNVGPYHSK
ncbi:MAG TPA: polysaccharide deacetylase family protein [Pseudogracilibacillus sp.]|nr:polysaccharide deacetylase family protein [Pseudogracilibacillus sp.]